ncbi:MAG: outer membrane protein W [Myxococcota bacterium]|jgi:outer membrane protein W
MRRLLPILVLGVATVGLLAPQSAEAQLYGVVSESPQTMQIEFKFGPYTPNIDQSGGGDTYATIFQDPMFMFRTQLDFQVYRGIGTIGIGGEIGIATVDGASSLDANNFSGSSDTTTFWMVPLALTVSYNFDYLATRYDIPIVPYVQAGLDYYLWWFTDDTGATSSAPDVAAGKNRPGVGGTYGWHATVGLKILLDVFAPQMAQTFDIEIGVNNSYIFAQLLYASVNDFGKEGSWDLGELTGLYGIAFEF